MDDWLLSQLSCPRHKGPLHEGAHDRLACDRGCSFPVVDGVPVLLLEEAGQTLWVAEASLSQSRDPRAHGPWFVESLGISEADRRLIGQLAASDASAAIDPVISMLVLATCGNAYRHLKGSLASYPIPELRLPPSDGQLFIDVGCNWGRWCIAAARKGYRAIGIDPSLGAVMAARRLATKLGMDCRFVVGDARFLPIRTACVDRLFSYSVLQHLDKRSVLEVLEEVRRVLRPSGSSHIQMPSKLGIRCVYQQARRAFREARGFEVRYWGYGELRDAFSSAIGETQISVDCYFGIGLQRSDLPYMTVPAKGAILLSEQLRRWSERLPLLRHLADSLYLNSRRTPGRVEGRR